MEAIFYLPISIIGHSVLLTQRLFLFPIYTSFYVARFFFSFWVSAIYSTLRLSILAIWKSRKFWAFTSTHKPKKILAHKDKDDDLPPHLKSRHHIIGYDQESLPFKENNHVWYQLLEEYGNDCYTFNESGELCKFYPSNSPKISPVQSPSEQYPNRRPCKLHRSYLLYDSNTTSNSRAFQDSFKKICIGLSPVRRRTDYMQRGGIIGF
jgi:hypothetical protein